MFRVEGARFSGGFEFSSPEIWVQVLKLRDSGLGGSVHTPSGFRWFGGVVVFLSPWP